MSETKPCKFLYTNPPECDTTYGDSLGQKWDNLHLAYIVSAVILTLITIFQTVRVVNGKGWKKATGDTQIKVHLFSSIIAVTYCVRAGDPAGWDVRMPLTIVNLGYDVAASSAYSLILLIVRDWVSVIIKVTGRVNSTDLANNVFIAIGVFWWVGFVTCSVLQSNLNDMWLYRGIKLFIGALGLVFVLVIQSYTGIVIWKTLHETEKAMKKQSLPLSSSNQDTTFSGETSARSISVSVQSSKPMMSSNAEKKKSRISRVLKLLCVSGSIEIVIMLVQISSALSEFSNKYTKDNPPAAPETTSDMIFEMSFDILVAIASLTALFFFRLRTGQVKKPAENEVGSDIRLPAVPSSRARKASSARAKSRRQRSTQFNSNSMIQAATTNTATGSAEVSHSDQDGSSAV